MSVGDVAHFNPDLDTEPPVDSVRELRRVLADAHGLVVSSPEYAHGIPGALKNAFDWVVGTGHGFSGFAGAMALAVLMLPIVVRSSEEMLEALHAARRAEGRWPQPRAWETATKDHPTRRAYVRRFGSWAAAIEAAIYSVTHRPVTLITAKEAERALESEQAERRH